MRLKKSRACHKQHLKVHSYNFLFRIETMRLLYVVCGTSVKVWQNDDHCILILYIIWLMVQELCVKLYNGHLKHWLRLTCNRQRSLDQI